MIWLTWRQHRAEAFVAAAALALLAVVLILTGRDMAATFARFNLADCLAHPAHPNCADALHQFRDQYGFWLSASGWLNFAPALLAILVGAPLVARELEHGTHRMIWTQSVAKPRWLAVKLALVLGAALLAAGILTILMIWWRTEFDTLFGRFDSLGFDFEGIAPLGYMAFALALAIAAGTLLRRAIPAMVVTLAGFLAVRLPIEFFLRPHYQPPLTLTADPLVNTQAVSDQAWVIDSGFMDAHGGHVDFSHILNTCAPPGNNIAKSDIFQCAHTHGWLQYVTFQPADRFWAFQGIETAIFLVLAAALLALTVYWVRHRIS